MTSKIHFNEFSLDWYKDKPRINKYWTNQFLSITSDLAETLQKLSKSDADEECSKVWIDNQSVIKVRKSKGKENNKVAVNFEPDDRFKKFYTAW